MGPIPWTAIITYSEIYELDEEEREFLVYHVQQLDNAFLEWENKKLDKK